MRLGGAALASGIASPALANIGAANVRSLALNNLHTGERAKLDYWADGNYIKDALISVNRLLRDHRNGQVHEMAPALFDYLHQLLRNIGVSAEVQVISAYRSPATNAVLRAQGSGVATRSLHMDGKAMDIRVTGVSLDRLRDAALAMRAGGVGYYPESNFVHVDVGPVRRW